MDETAQKLLALSKGILAADESTKTITERFANIGLESTPELNRKYREMLITAPGIENYLSGIIFFDETVRQKVEDTTFPEYVRSLGILPGIKVDQGLEPFNGTEEKISKGIDDLEERLMEYGQLGLKFTKWRAAIAISDIFPTDKFLDENMERLAIFAETSQRSGFVPVIEPEILLKGNHTTTRCSEIEVKVLKTLFEKINAKNVDLKGLILKTSMVLPGKDSGVKAEPLEVAHATLNTLRKSVPPDVAGIVFLSGGQSPDEATNNLNEIVKLKEDAPWKISFSYARALQEEAMGIWLGMDKNIKTAQNVFISRLSKVSKARNGQL